MSAEYFKYRVPERPLDDATTQAIHQAALGIPLAVKEAAAIWQKPAATLSDITGDGAPSRDRDHIVQTMTERFLLHCWDDPRDRQRLYALALAYQPDADLLSAMLDTQDLEAELSELERRHSFVFVTDMKLHDKVSVWIREYLQAEIHRKSNDVRGLNQRAGKHLRERLTQQETLLSLLEDRVADESWTAATTALTYHAFWLDEVQGWSVLLPAFVGGLGYDRDFARALLGAARPLDKVFNTAGERRLKTLAAGVDWSATPEQDLALLAELESTQRVWPVDGGEAERRVILDLRYGEMLLKQKKLTNALEYLEHAKSLMPTNGQTLARLLARTYHDMGDMEKELRHYDEAAIALQIAVDNDPKNGTHRKCLGDVYRYSNKPFEAISSYKKAIELGTQFGQCYGALGYAYIKANLPDEAIDASKRATEIDPQDSECHLALANSYYSANRFSEALIEYRRAIKLILKIRLHIGVLAIRSEN